MAETPSELQTEIEKLEARHAEHPEGRFFVPLANAYRKTGEIGRAEAVLREGLRRHPDYLSAHIVLGRCLADRGATGEAVAEFQHVLSIDPQNLIALRTLGELAMASGRADESASWYQQLLEVDPMNEEARRALDSLAEPVPQHEPETDWWAETGTAPMSETSPEPAAAPAAIPAQPAPPYSADDGDQDADATGGEVTGEVVTETIAELYARQGLVDRAVEVYRELIRRRGGDAALERRIAELMAPPAPPEPPAVPEPQLADALEHAVVDGERSPADAEEAPREKALVENEVPQPYDEPLPVLGEVGALAGSVDELSLVDSDPFASSFEYGFLDEELTARAPEARVSDAADWFDAEQPFEEPQPHATESGGRTITGYLGELAAWQPGAGVGSRGEVPAESFEAGGIEPAIDMVAELEAEIAEPDVEIAEPWVDAVAEAEVGGSEPRVAEPWVSAASAADAVAVDAPAPGASLDDDLPFPWETPENTGSAHTPGAPVASSADEDEPFPFESFFTEAETAGQSPAQPATDPAAPAPGPSSAPAPATQEEEDDLESFQAWLRSLKR
ncbi:MAG: tetratricopeptide repeat protein [Gemmatimonadetes bacterium]|nr:tetratricopeptide repeat protein [Gemmatimonadota bacterium]